MELLEKRTTRVNVDRIERYATPLLRVKNAPKLHFPKKVCDAPPSSGRTPVAEEASVSQNLQYGSRLASPSRLHS